MNPIRLAGLALLVVAMSCRDGVAPQSQTAELEAAHQRWRTQNLHTYAFTLQRDCFCPNTHPLYVFVLSDTVAGVLDLETGTMVDRQFGATVEYLFTFVQNAIDRSAKLIRAEYDPFRGFPTRIDYAQNSPSADGELTYRASDVHPVTPPASP